MERMSRIDIGNNIRKPKVVVATAEGFRQAANDPVTGRVTSELADLWEHFLRGELTKDEYRKLKGEKKLACHFYTPHAHFLKGYKSQEGEPQDSGKAVIDLDGCEHFEVLYSQHLMGRERALGINMVNRSVSGTGGHVLFDIPQGLTRQQAQAWMAREILGGTDYDAAVHEPERAIYIPCSDYILYQDEELMFSDELHPATLTEDVVRKYATNEECGVRSVETRIHGGEKDCKAADERTRFIAEGVMKAKGLERSDFVSEGGRHTTVKIFLSGATQLLTKAEVNGLLAELMPDHWQDDNIQQLVDAFYQNYTNPSQRLTRYQEQLFTQSRRMEQTRRQGDETPSVAPQMPKMLPKLIKLLTSRTPDVYKPAVAHAVFPALATHLHEVRFNYTDNVEHEATLMNCLMAGTGSGKGCIDEPITHIMADIKRRDKVNEEREREWKKECTRRGDNKDKQPRPEGLVIQMIDSDMTKPALVTRLEEAEGHFVYVKLNELDLFEQLKGQNGKQHFQLMCLAFDPGAEYGQTRIGTQSVTARPQCRFNWNACTTILKGRRFFSKVLTDGPISRINFCHIPEQEIGFDQPVFGKYDAEFDEQLKPYIDNLVAARGLTDCPQAFRLAKKLQQEVADFARLSQNETYWNLSHRACVIAWLKACVLYVANGCKWEKAFNDFISWSLHYDLWCKMQFFGKDIEKAAYGEGARIGTRGPRNLLELLPDQFTLDDAKRVRQQEGATNEGRKAEKMIRTWINRGYVIQNTEYSFKKSEKYLSKNH
jgi:hypothetical protein